MKIDKKTIQWVTVPLDLRENSWEKSWKEYKRKLNEILREEFGINEEELKNELIGSLMELVEKNLKILTREGRVLTEIDKERIQRPQTSIYNELIRKIEEKEWVEKTSELAKKFAIIEEEEECLSLPSKQKERTSHTRSTSLPPRLKLSLTKEKEEGLVPEAIDNRCSEIIEVDEKEVRIQEIQSEKEVLQKKNEQLEGRLLMIELQKKIEEKNNEIIDFKKLIETNSKVAKELVEKGIIAVDDQTYLKNNQRIEEKINEYQKEKENFASQLENLRLQLEFQVQIPPKNFC